MYKNYIYAVGVIPKVFVESLGSAVSKAFSGIVDVALQQGF